MTKSKFKVETLVFSMFMAVQVLLPLSMNAQGGRSDSFFGSGIEANELRDVDWLVFGLITNESFKTPVGDGLLLLTAAGAGYLICRKKFKV